MSKSILWTIATLILVVGVAFAISLMLTQISGSAQGAVDMMNRIRAPLLIFRLVVYGVLFARVLPRYSAKTGIPYRTLALWLGLFVALTECFNVVKMIQGVS